METRMMKSYLKRHRVTKSNFISSKTKLTASEQLFSRAPMSTYICMNLNRKQSHWKVATDESNFT